MTKPALEAAAVMLAMRPLTRKMLLDKLREKEYDDDEATLAADAMEELGALDDVEYAQAFAADRAARGWGTVRIRSELTRRGVDRDTVDEVLDELDDPSDAIHSFIQGKLRGAELDRKMYEKIAAGLQRRGFTWDQIRPILNEYRD